MSDRSMVPAFLLEDGAHALCSETDPEAFFPELGESSREAKAVCNRCELRDPCLAFALQHDVSGVWGASSENQRRRIRQSNPAPRSPRPITHGTASGYKSHLRRDEQPCEECRASHRRRLQDQRKRGVA